MNATTHGSTYENGLQIHDEVAPGTPGSRPYRAIVVGASAGGMAALKIWVSGLPAEFGKIIMVVQHLYPQSDSGLHRFLSSYSALPVIEVQDKMALQPGAIYTAPANYHTLVETDETVALTVDDKWNYSRPSIDILFESAARVWTTGLVGIVLTGANYDGAAGLKAIKQFGGMTLVQDPATAEFPAMPNAAIAAGAVDHILPLKAIAPYLVKLAA